MHFHPAVGDSIRFQLWQLDKLEWSERGFKISFTIGPLEHLYIEYDMNYTHKINATYKIELSYNVKI